MSASEAVPDTSVIVPTLSPGPRPPGGPPHPATIAAATQASAAHARIDPMPGLRTPERSFSNAGRAEVDAQLTGLGPRAVARCRAYRPSRRTRRGGHSRHCPRYHPLGAASITPYFLGTILNGALTAL